MRIDHSSRTTQQHVQSLPGVEPQQFQPMTLLAVLGIGTLGSVVFGLGWALLFGWHVGAVVAGLLWTIAGGGTVLVVCGLAMTEALDDRAWRRAARTAQIDAYQESNGLVTHESVSETTIRSDNPAHLLLLALALHQQVCNGTPAPWSVNNLCGPQFLSFGRKAVRIGEVSSREQAQDIANTLASAGLIDGRRERSAGQWNAVDTREVLEMMGVSDG
jgi:hypothetical protein